MERDEELAGSLVGGWLLRRWSIAYPDGRPDTLPFGDDATGLLLYGADGWMSATMCRAEREALAPALATTPTDADRARAFDGYLAYAGRWSVQGDVVAHEVVMSMNPVLIGTLQLRQAVLVGDELELGADETDARGRSRRHSILWRRAR
jgi:hypothetical protein